MWLKDTLKGFSALSEALPISSSSINPYRLVHKLTSALPENSICVCSDGTACVVGFQAAVFKRGQRMFHNSGCASMGYELPAAIGAWHAAKQTVVCLAGDGSIMMNLQELAIIGGKQLPIKIVLINNQGYHSIRQTQENYFPENPVGCGAESGLPFPSFEYLCKGFDIHYSIINEELELENALSKFLSTSYPELMEVCINQDQQFAPKLASKKLSNGSMISDTFDDMSPHLSSDLLHELQVQASSIKVCTTLAKKK